MNKEAIFSGAMLSDKLPDNLSGKVPDDLPDNLLDKLYMASSVLNYLTFSLSSGQGDIEMPEKTSIGLCYVLGYCQSLIDNAEREGMILLDTLKERAGCIPEPAPENRHAAEQFEEQGEDQDKTRWTRQDVERDIMT